MSKYPGNIITSGANAGYSVAFDGTGDSLVLADNAAFEFGSGDFTVEAWVYVTATPGASGASIITKSSATYPGGYEFNFVVQNDRKAFFGFYTTSQIDLTGTTALSLNTWAHLAVSRSGSNFALFVNGTREATQTSSGTIQATSSSLYLGDYGGGSRTLTGYISNARIVKGTAVYDPTQTTIRVPTQLFNVPGTSLLTCNSPAIVDQSSNNFTITANGNAAVSTFTPFQGYVAYNPALGAATPGIWTVSDAIQAAQTRRWNMYDPYFNLTTLLLHGNGTNGAQNNTFLDSSSNNFTITRNGNTTQGTFSPFSQTGWSNYLNGSSSLDVASNAALALGTGDFTYEIWLCDTATQPAVANAAHVIGVNATGGCVLRVFDTGIDFNVYNGSSLITYSVTRKIGAWYHLAYSRSGTTGRLFYNGTLVGTATDSTNYTSSSNFIIGSNPTTGQFYTGYVSNARVVKGTALYTSSFTPSATPLTAVSGTSLLTCQSNRFVDNSSNGLAVTVRYSTPSVQAFSPFYPLVAYTPQAQGGSGYFDGTGDYLSVGSAANWTFLHNTTAAWTMEFWVYNTTTGSATTLLDTNNSTTGSTGVTVQKLSNELINVFITYSSAGNNIVNGTSTIALRANAWNHVFISYNQSLANTNLVFYINGAAAGTANKTANTPSSGNPANALSIGCYGTGAGQFFPGYISSLRISNTVRSVPSGVPTAPYTSDANTALLTNFTNAAIIDSTGDNVLETVGNASISTTQSKFGGSSLAFTGGTANYLVSSNVTNYTLYGAFTIEAWVYRNSSTARVILVEGRTAGGYANYLVGILPAGTIEFVTSNSGNFYNPSIVVPSNQWAHVALVRNTNNVVTAYVNGVAASTTVTISGVLTPAAGLVWIGGQRDASSDGYIDDLRITQFARYTGNFTPQTSQWQDQ